MMVRFATLLALGTAAVLVNVSVPFAARDISGPAPAGDSRAERTIYATVLGPEGPVVDGISAEEIRVREDNLEREVIGIKPAEEPLSAVLMIDTTAAAREVIQDLRKAVVDYATVLLSMSPNARLALAEFAGVGMITQRFTSSLEDIQNRANKIVANIPMGTPGTDVSTSPSSDAVFNEGLIAACDELEKEPTQRRVIVTVNMEPTGEDSTVRIADVAARVRNCGATVFSVAILLRAERNANRDVLLNGITANSGGLRTSINSVTALNGLLGTIAAISAAQWAVTFARPGDAPAAERTEAAITRPGFRVLTNAWSTPAGAGDGLLAGSPIR
jgi:hypothetical protein